MGTTETGLAVTAVAVAVAVALEVGGATIGGVIGEEAVVTDGVVVILGEGEVALTAVIKDGEILSIRCTLASAVFRM